MSKKPDSAKDPLLVLHFRTRADESTAVALNPSLDFSERCAALKDVDFYFEAAEDLVRHGWSKYRRLLIRRLRDTAPGGRTLSLGLDTLLEMDLREYA